MNATKRSGMGVARIDWLEVTFVDDCSRDDSLDARFLLFVLSRDDCLEVDGW